MRQVLQSKTVVPAHLASWVQDDVIKDAGTTFINTFGKFVTTLLGVNFNLPNNDNPVTINLPPGDTRYRMSHVIISGASANLSGATCGLFTGVSAGGIALVPSGTSVSVTQTAQDTNLNMQLLPINNQDSQSMIDPQLFFRTQAAVSGTANVSIFYEPLPFPGSLSVTPPLPPGPPSQPVPPIFG